METVLKDNAKRGSKIGEELNVVRAATLWLLNVSEFIGLQ